MIIFSLLYNFGISAYHFLINLSALSGKEKARLWKKGRENWAARMREAIPAGTSTIWVHAASLGEFEQGRPVLEALRTQYPQHKILLTFFSPSGYEVRKNYKGADYVYYLPLDTRRNARIFLDIAQPELALFIKYEFWYHMLTALHIRKIPTLLVSGIFRPGQVFFKWYGGPFRRILKQLTHIFVQNELSEKLLAGAGITNVSISGDTRFDRVWALRNERRELPVIEAFCKERAVIVAGSTWPADEQLLASYWPKAPENLALIIAPHEIDAAHIAQILERFPQALRYTQLAAGNAKQRENDSGQREDNDVRSANVLIIDNIGMLSALYRYGKVAYVGGGFGKEGIHNILEPATYGRPVLYGPVFDKFPEAPALIAAGGGFVIDDAGALEQWLHTYLTNTTAYNTAAHAASAYVEAAQGATGKVLDYIQEKRFLSKP